MKQVVEREKLWNNNIDYETDEKQENSIEHPQSGNTYMAKGIWCQAYGLKRTKSRPKC